MTTLPDHVLVPREATIEMIREGYKAAPNAINMPLATVYRAMLAASPPTAGSVLVPCEELLPCPFCGGRTQPPATDGDAALNPKRNSRFVECETCGANIYRHRDTQQEADAALIEAWNARATTAGSGVPDAIAGLVNALRPFADLADRFEAAHRSTAEKFMDEGFKAPPPRADFQGVTVKLGDCRNAREALVATAHPSHPNTAADDNAKEADKLTWQLIDFLAATLPKVDEKTWRTLMIYGPKPTEETLALANKYGRIAEQWRTGGKSVATLMLCLSPKDLEQAEFIIRHSFAADDNQQGEKT